MFGMKPKVNTDPEKINDLLTRGIEKIFPNEAFLQSKMLRGEQVKLYLGIDPTGSTLHLGHVIPLKKLAGFQKLGHKVILLIGDFTAMIGDPTDKTAARVQLTREQVLANCKEYKKQASKFISFEGNNSAELRFNSEWLDKLSYRDGLELASHMTVQQMLSRDMFEKRMKDGMPIYIHEFMYPLMQGYDSVAMDVDGEIGGNDQTWNMLAGRDLLKDLKQKEKFVVATRLLTDSTGKKMGKSEGNMVSLNQTPEEMFGSVMSWSDELIIPGFEIITDISMSEIVSMKTKMEEKANPKEFKLRLAREIVTLCYDQTAAKKAQDAFESTFSDGGIPENIDTITTKNTDLLIDVLVAHNIVESKTDFKRLVDAGAVTNLENQMTITDFKVAAERGTYKIGKRRFVKIQN